MPLMPSGVELIAQERQRQIEEKGYTPQLDIGRQDELARAGASYADHVAAKFEGQDADEPHPFWPWGEESWKPGEAEIETLIKAGALIAAAIDATLGWEA